ncbi:hypothetical protein GGI42DRAFT_104303 [Trichoderma sp. SZMC 28013]
MLTYVYYECKSLRRSGSTGIELHLYLIGVDLSWVFFGIRFLILENHGGLYERVRVTSFSLRGNPDTRLAFTNTARELLEEVTLTTILSHFLTEVEARTVVMSWAHLVSAGKK